MENGDQPICPVPHQNQDGTIQHDVYFGLTKREYFAALAMQGFAANEEWIKTMKIPDDWDELRKRLANGAVEMADALLEELQQKDKS